MAQLGFGLMRLPLTDTKNNALIDEKQLCDMVDLFLKSGFTYFDTAYMYHDAQSEVAIRKALVERYDRDRFTLATKMPVVYLKEKGDLERFFAEQQTKCGVDFFDYYLLHNLGAANYETAKRFDAFSFIQEKKRAGLARKIGFSYHDNAALLDQILTEHPEVDFVQLQINYCDWDSVSIQSGKCYEVARKHKKPVVVMEPVKGGTLTKLPPAAKELFFGYAPDASLASWAIRFAASLEGVMVVLSGMSELAQMRDNTRYMKDFVPLSEEERAVIACVQTLLQKNADIPCTGCGYCTDGCPQSIAIPQCFALYNADRRAPSKGFSIQEVYYENLLSHAGGPADCVACGQCEAACPQHIPIIEKLAAVKKHFQD